MAELDFKAKAIYERLCDDESRELFMCRYNYFVTGDSGYLVDELRVSKRYHKSTEVHGILEFIDLAQNNTKLGAECVLYGAGYYGSFCIDILTRQNVKVRALCDSSADKHGKSIKCIDIIPPQRLIDMHSGFPILISVLNGRSKAEIYEFLITHGIEKENIYFFYPDFHKEEKQYFGLPFISPQTNEVYVDAGCYDGGTILDFFEFAGKGRVYGFEPDENSYNRTVGKLKECQITNAVMFKKGLWSRNETLYFDNTLGVGNNISSEGAVTIETVSLDEALPGGEKVTFIKMDIEGAELEALRGARNTVMKNLPRLAICIYHKPEDIITIPDYIMSLSPDYVFYIRHHLPWLNNETVLYAIIK
jgi:FkbM family methyltransferase